MMKNIKNEKAITLLALVITIIVLLILAAITIGQLQNSGLFNKTQVAKETYSFAEAQEQLELEIANLKMQMYANNTGSTTSLNDLKSYLESDKFDGEYLVELFYEPMAATEQVQTTPVYAKVTHLPTQFVFYVDGNLIVFSGEKTNVEIASDRDTVTIPKEEYDMLKNNYIYSENEQRIGTWINGKPLYQKTFMFSSMSLSAGAQINFGSLDGLNIEYGDIVKTNFSEDGYFVGEGDIKVWIRKPNNGFGIIANSDRNGTLYFTIQYTKTTDTAPTN